MNAILCRFKNPVTGAMLLWLVGSGIFWITPGVYGEYEPIRQRDSAGLDLASDSSSSAAPPLKLRREDGELLLSWPVSGSDGFVLYTSGDLKTWTEVPFSPDEVETRHEVRVPEPGSRQFFRLQHAPSSPREVRLPNLESSGWDRQEVRSGVVYYERHFEDFYGNPQVFNVLAVDLDNPEVRIELTATDVWGLTRMPIPDLAEHGGAIAAINGGFAPARVYEEVGYGIMKFRGEVWPFVNDPSFNDTYEAHGRNAVGIDKAGEWHFTSRGEEGWETSATWAEDWPGMVDAMAGGSHLVRDGKVHPLVVLETTQGAYLEIEVLHRLTFNRHPRTAIGITEDRIAVMLTAAGRFPGKAAGVTLHEAANLMIYTGCRDALELDGGGSTTMWIGDEPFGGVVNYPTDNGEFDHEGLRSLRLGVLVMEGE